MDRPKEPLAWRLQNAALERTQGDSELVDDVVLESDGVIDLRAFDVERRKAGASVADPAAALAGIRGRFGDAADVSDLYDRSEDPQPRWRLGLRARHAYGEQVPSALPDPAAPEVVDDEPAATPLEALTRISVVPLSTELPAQDDDTGVVTSESLAETIDPEIDLRDEDRPTSDCPKCAGIGRRDLFDRFSRIEFYSCDHCLHMWQQDFSD
ncbi:MAG: hypothetical protein AAF548_02875 [Actinomycetota bacterium]